MEIQRSEDPTVRPTETHPEPDHGPSRQQLDAFVGRWIVEGTNGTGAPASTGAEMQGTESYEWLEGEFYLINRWDRHFGQNRHTGISFIGYDSSLGEYFSQSFDNLGFAARYKVYVAEGALRFQGPEERAVLKLNADRSQIDILWEQSKDGLDWAELCHLIGHREQ